MTVLNVCGVGKSYGTDVIIKDATFKVGNTDKVGIVGVNGTGKTTLLRLISGEEESDSGTVAFDKRTVLAYMHQNADYTSQKTAVEEVEEVFDEVKHIASALEEINRKLESSSDETLIARQSTLQERFMDLGGMTYHSRSMSALLGLGLTKEQIELPVSCLSGGQRTCVLLAKILLSGANLILLDEPTNHLDIRATEWLEDFLMNYDGAVMVVSHDRFFLDRVCNKIIETENTKVTLYGGNYTYYKEKKAFDRETLRREYEKTKGEIERIEGIIEQQKRFNQERNYITIKSKQHEIDKLKETLVAPDKLPQEIHFTFRPFGAPGNEILKTRNLSLAFGDNVLLQNAELEIRKGEKVFLAGPNGCGKSTLLKRIIRAADSAVVVGAGVKMGYYEQTGAIYNPNKTVFETLSDAYPRMNNTEIRTALGSFLFHGDDVFKRVGDLSGGEKARITLTILMLSETNFLILDEPTNHLDMASKEKLEEALKSYAGTLLVVSHDRYFVNSLADKIYYIEDKALKCHRGNYASLLDVMRAPVQSVATKNEAAAEAYAQRKQEGAQARKMKKRLEWLENHIPMTEQEISDLDKQMQSPEIASDYVKLGELMAQKEEKQKLLDGYYEEWGELSE